MPDLGPKRIREFIRAVPGRAREQGQAPRDNFDPGRHEEAVEDARGEQILTQGIELLAEYQTRLAAQDTYGVLVVLQAMDAAGKDGTIRHVMSGVDPQGVQVQQLQGPVVRGSRPRLPVALRQEACRNGATSGSSTAPTTRRSSSSASTRRSSTARSCRQLSAPASGTAGSGDQRLGALPDRPGVPVRQAVPNLSHEEQRRRFLSRIDEPDKNWEFSANDARERELLGRLPEGLQRRAHQDEHRRGRRGRDPCRRQAVRPGRRRRRPCAHADRDRPAFPKVSQARRARGGEGGPRGPGAGRCRARPDRGRDGREGESCDRSVKKSKKEGTGRAR